MSGNPDALSGQSGNIPAPSANGTYSDIADFILGITHEIWEGRQVDRILDYYAEDIDVFSLEGIIRGAAKMVEQTHATLEAFPDRLLLGDDVIWSGSLARGFSSHRIISPMTNRGDTIFGPASGKHVRTMNIADCEITEGRITREWLLRDNLALIRQLGFDPLTAAGEIARRSDDVHQLWLEREFTRVVESQASPVLTIGQAEEDREASFARQVLENCWSRGNRGQLEAVYAPYCVLQRAPVRLFSGRSEVLKHYADWRRVFPGAKLSIDHVCSQTFDDKGRNIAVRWSVAAYHEGSFAGLEPGGRPVFVVGVTHWKVLDGRIIAEWTVFDELSMLAQALEQIT
jgi:predicted ester cyclase